MRVLHLETGRHLYGGAQQVLHLVHGLAQKNTENLLVCSKNSEFAAKAASVGLKTLEMPMRGDLDALFGVRLMQAVSRFKPDILHVHSRRGADMWGGVAAWMHGTKAVITRRVDNPEKPFIARIKYSFFDRVITISRGISEVLLRYGVPEKKIICVHSAVQADHYRTECEQNWFRNELHLGPDDLPVGMVAQFISRKGHHVLIKAIPDIIEACPNARFLFFGRGPLLDECRQSVQDMGLDNVVRFPGFREDLHRILPCLALVVHPALMEGLGVSLLQAAASSVPIVATPVGGIPEIVRHGRNGLLVQVHDHESLAQAVIDLLMNPHARAGMGRKGRSIVERDFSIPSMVEGNLQVYRDVLQESP